VVVFIYFQLIIFFLFFHKKRIALMIVNKKLTILETVRKIVEAIFSVLWLSEDDPLPNIVKNEQKIDSKKSYRLCFCHPIYFSLLFLRAFLFKNPI